MLAGRDDARIDVLRDRLFLGGRFLGGLGRMLLFQPPLDLRIGEQCHELGDLRRCRRLSARRRCPARSLIRRRSPRQQGGRYDDRRNARPHRPRRCRWSFSHGDHRCHGPKFPVTVFRHFDLPAYGAPTDLRSILRENRAAGDPPLTAPAAPRRCRRAPRPSVLRGRARLGRHRRARICPLPRRTERSSSRDSR